MSDINKIVSYFDNKTTNYQIDVDRRLHLQNEKLILQDKKINEQNERLTNFYINHSKGNAYAPAIVETYTDTDILVCENVTPIDSTLDVNVSSAAFMGLLNQTASGSDGMSRYQYYINNIESGTYRLTAEFTQQAIQMPVKIEVTDNNDIFGSSIVLNAMSGKFIFEFTIPEGKTSCFINFYSNCTTDTGFAQCVYKNITIEKSDFSDVTVKRIGKNLIPPERATPSDVSYSGVTHTLNDDGSITVNGTSLSSYYWFIPQGGLILPAGTYTLSCGLDNTMWNTCYMSVKTGNTEIYSYGNNKTFTLNEATSVGVCIGVYKGYTVNNVTFYPQIEMGAVATEYEAPVIPQSITSDKDGNINGFTAVSPTTILMSDKKDILITANFVIDTKAYIDKKITEALNG